MKKERKLSILKWILYYLLLILFFSLQTAPYAFEFFSIKPVFILPLAVIISMFEDIMPSSIFSVITGLLLDISSGTLFGFNGVLLLVICVFTNLFFVFFLHQKLLNELIFTTVSVFFQSGLNFFFCYILWEYENTGFIFLRYTLPTTVYTIAVSVPIYLIIKKISFKIRTAQGYI